MKHLLACTAALGLAAAAPAQMAGSTYPEGSNVPQRTGGEVSPKPVGQPSGSGGTGAPVHSRAKARPHHAARRHHAPKAG